MYNSFPEINIKNYQEVLQGYESIIQKIKLEFKKASMNVITIECYPTTNEKELLENLIQPLKADYVIHADDFFFSATEITNQIQENLTEDRIFGVMSHQNMADFIDYEKYTEFFEKVMLNKEQDKKVVIYGVGASLLYDLDVVIYADLARWEVQNRYRSGVFSNWKADNYGEDSLRMVKRGYFFEWPVADRLKRALFDKVDYFLDMHQEGQPIMVDASSYQKALEQVVQQPFRLVPYFDPGVWGGTWMQKNLGIDQDKPNLAWGFDGVPEENSLYLKFGSARMEIPANNVVFSHPIPLLGQRVYGRFGAEFPIRFDFLDTVGGGNLSLQVHPLTGYAQEVFDSHYTQDESYYILEAEEDATIYLGLKNGTDKDELMTALSQAELGETSFPDEKYIYQRKVEKHDHYSIPAGTIHCGGSNAVVLEISATPNRFTFKLWDWGRLGLDGLPRPVHLDHGSANIIADRDANWVERELVNPFEIIAEGKKWVEERTGLHETEFIETRRHTFSGDVIHETHGSVNVLNLVEGEEAVVESLAGEFEPFVIHFGETFIIPEMIKEYRIKPYGKSIGKELKTIKAFVR
ncbi:class I mannose-6-phosphate isomerase [Carnobacterium gallinarum]|uniref:class I mannose-6-phosphate isomerase n=1 Tax=Carnobacterium gallinarum TaxID=2749 RepID=UPI0005560018|nr:class I mannose-6-phosphate isomerase [Carnobacterium gallinarum]